MRRAIATRRRGTVVALLTTLALTGLASCSSDDEPGDEPSSSGASSSAGGTGTDPVADGDTPPALDRPRPAQKALTIDSCESGDGELKATGTIRNREKKPVDFIVTADWQNEQSKVIGTGFDVLEDVEPGKPTKWSIDITLDETSTACTTRANSGKLLD